MSLLKPQPGMCLDRAHPLAQRLIQCWLFNEGAGQTLHDRARGLIATGDPAPTWGLDHCVFNGSDEAFVADLPIDAEEPYSIVMQVRLDPISSECNAVGFGHPAYNSRLAFGCFTSGQYRVLLREDDNSNVVNAYPSSNIDDGIPHQLVFVFDADAGHYYCYVDGQALYDGTPDGYSSIHFSRISIGAAYYYGSLSSYWPGSIYHIYVYGRALTASEVAQLWHKPYIMFRRSDVSVAISSSESTLDISASVSAITDCGATASVVRGLTGEAAASSQANASLSDVEATSLSAATSCASSLSGTLQHSSEVIDVTSAGQRDALFAGMTARALKLGTTLTSGWFWTRRSGCSALYRGHTLEDVDFDHILCVAGPCESRVSLPSYLVHESNSVYVYVVRRFNGCGHQEQTYGAATTVDIAGDGELAGPAPNAVFGLTVEPVSDGRVTLRWFYSSLQQEAEPKAFTILDTKGITLGTVLYAGSRFYQFQTESLAPGSHTFHVRAVTAAGIEGPATAAVTCQITTNGPPAPTVLSIEAIS